MKTKQKTLTDKERKRLIAEMLQMNEGIEAHQVPEPPADLEPGARKLFYMLRRAASIALITGDELANFCRSYHAIQWWKHERETAIIYGYHRKKEEAEKELDKHYKVLTRYDQVLLSIVYEVRPDLRPDNNTNGQHRTDD